MQIKNISIVGKNRCTGCGSCLNSCPVSAIHMEYDEEGFLFPVIDSEKCISCGKCFSACPEIEFEKTEAFRNKQRTCYAVMASDEIRWNSSSGGMFTLLADYVLERGGIVFGAAYESDFSSVHHIGIENENQLNLLRSSKYVQSDTQNTYSEVKKALKANRMVLYTGCPCQIAGLYRFLGEDPENLITADIICHAANSTFAYRSYLSEISNGKTITDVDFRKKENYGWITNVNVYFSDGSSYIEHPDKTKAEWYIGFLRGIINRPCCPTCHYTKLSRMGDFTLGDFWKVTDINKSWHDGKGTSLVFVNSEKAGSVFSAVQPKMKLCERTEITEEFAKKANGQLVRPTKEHPGRETFFRLLPKEGYHKALQAALAVVPPEPQKPKTASASSGSIKEAASKTGKEKKVRTGITPRLAPLDHYDVGLTGYWWSSNYGSVATYYALYKLIEEMGYSVILIDRWEKENHPDGLDVFSRKFMESHLNTSASTAWYEMPRFSDLCDTFVIGSDQVWSPGAITAYQYMFFLDFVRPEKRKIAYAASFGENFNVTEDKLAPAEYYISQFNKLSVREFQAVDICREKFHKDAEWVMDPVFVIDRHYWDDLAAQAQRTEKDILGEIPEQGFMLSYLLNPSEEKKQILQEASEALGLPLINILHGKAHSFEKNRKILDLPNTPQDVTEEEWLYFIKNAKYVITDSHHGAALSIIFNRQFICCSDKKWGGSRFESLFGLLGLKSRLSITAEDIRMNNLLGKEIDYEKVNRILEERCAFSKQWLTQALKEEEPGEEQEQASASNKCYMTQKLTQILKRVRDKIKKSGQQD